MAEGPERDRRKQSEKKATRHQGGKLEVKPEGSHGVVMKETPEGMEEGGPILLLRESSVGETQKFRDWRKNPVLWPSQTKEFCRGIPLERRK